MEREIIVSKFGGTSMADFQAMMRSAQVAASKKTKLTVVSATSGTTNKLIKLTDMALLGEIDHAHELIKEIKNRHFSLATELGLDEGPLSSMNVIIQELESLVQGIFFLKEVSPKAMDRLQSVGERLSSLLFTQALDKQIKKINPNYHAEVIDARDYILTDGQFNKAKPIIEQIYKNCQLLKEKINADQNLFLVTQGFIGRNHNGDTMTLGRGGSDYSASIFGEALEAKEIQIWTDVAGIATTDPRLVPEAKIIPELSFKEAAEMATFGAKILHPTTVLPAKRANIPVFVGSSYEPDKAGTWIKKQVESMPLVRSINLRRDQTLITLSNPRMLNTHGFLVNIFDTFNKHDISVDAITTSEISVAITINTSDLKNNELLNDLETYGKVSVEKNLCVVSVIGNNINHTSGLAGKIFQSLKDINVRMICQGASLHNFCFLLEESQGPLAVKQLHNTFIKN